MAATQQLGSTTAATAAAAPPGSSPAVVRAYRWIAKGDLFLNELQQGEPAHEAFRRAWDDISAHGSPEDRRRLYATLRTTSGYAMDPRPLPPGSGDRIYDVERTQWLVRGDGATLRAAMASRVGSDIALRSPSSGNPADAVALRGEPKARRRADFVGPPRRPSIPRPARGPRLLHVAYMSPDLNRNAVGLFVWPLFALHDPARFRVTIYNTRWKNGAAVSDAITCWHRRTAAALPHVRWRDVGHMVDDEALARRIHSDGVDVLVDLLGAGVGNRLGVLARRPAPRIVNYLGFPDTVDIAAVTHRITDGLVDPEREEVAGSQRSEEVSASRRSRKKKKKRSGATPSGAPEGPSGGAAAMASRVTPSGEHGVLPSPAGTAKGSTGPPAALASHPLPTRERLVRLPTRCFVCYAHWEDVWRCPPIAPRGDPAWLRVCISARPLKHNPRMLRLWREVLTRRPDMQLVVKEDVAGQVRIAELYADFPEGQVELLPAPSFHPAFMEGFNEVDLMLDPQPYSGTTMTCAALYMGVPSLSLYLPRGGRHVQNVSAAIHLHTQRHLAPLLAASPDPDLRSLTLERFVVPSLEAYADRMAALTREELELWRRARPMVAQAFRRTMDAGAFMGEFQEALQSISETPLEG
jgi:hypothetical protein